MFYFISRKIRKFEQKILNIRNNYNSVGFEILQNFLQNNKKRKFVIDEHDITRFVFLQEELTSKWNRDRRTQT